MRSIDAVTKAGDENVKVFSINDIKKLLNNEPTAYDVNKVVDELKASRDGYSTVQIMATTNDEFVNRFIVKEKAMNLAIKIVKGGGVDG